MSALSVLKIDQLSVEERIALIGEIWDSMAATPEKIPLTDAQKLELDRRLDAYQNDPTKVTSWEVIKAEALARTKQ